MLFIIDTIFLFISNKMFNIRISFFKAWSCSDSIRITVLIILIILEIKIIIILKLIQIEFFFNCLIYQHEIVWTLINWFFLEVMHSWHAWIYFLHLDLRCTVYLTYLLFVFYNLRRQKLFGVRNLSFLLTQLNSCWDIPA